MGRKSFSNATPLDNYRRAIGSNQRKITKTDLTSLRAKVDRKKSAKPFYDLVLTFGIAMSCGVFLSFIVYAILAYLKSREVTAVP
ncbi:hypothetical protein SprV_0100165900 [Sparganum proliferum]